MDTTYMINLIASVFDLATPKNDVPVLKEFEGGKANASDLENSVEKADASLDKEDGKSRKSKASTLLALANSPSIKGLHVGVDRELEDYEGYHGRKLEYLKHYSTSGLK